MHKMSSYEVEFIHMPSKSYPNYKPTLTFVDAKSYNWNGTQMYGFQESRVFPHSCDNHGYTYNLPASVNNKVDYIIFQSALNSASIRVGRFWGYQWFNL